MARRQVFRRRGTALATTVVAIVAGAAITSGIVGGSFDNADVAAPSLFITAPADGSTASGTTTVSATCGDNVGCAGVQFKLNGANLGAEDTSAPFSISWDTTVSGPGTYTLTAAARDAAGNTKTSNSLTIIVSPSGGGADVANVFVAANGSDVGVACVRNSTPIAPPTDPTKMCKTFDKAYHLANIGDVVRVACGYYLDSTDPQGYSLENFSRDSTKEAAAASTYVTFQPPPSQTVGTFGSITDPTVGIADVGTGCVRVGGVATDPGTAAVAAGHVELKDMYIGRVLPIGKSCSSCAPYEGTATDWWFQNDSIHQFDFTSVTRLKLIGGQVGETTGGCTTSLCGFVVASDGNRTLACGSGPCQENQIGCAAAPTGSSCNVGNTDVLIDGVNFHDVYRSNGVHSACLGGIESTNRLTIRNVKFWNCDSQTLHLTFSTQGGTLANKANQNVLLENDWFTPSTDVGGTTSPTSESIDFKANTGYTLTNWVIRNSVFPGGITWSNDNGTPVSVSNFVMIGDFVATLNCSGAPGGETPTSGLSDYYIIYTSTNGSCTGSGNTPAAFGLVNSPFTNEAGLNYDLTGSPTACNFVPASAYANPTTFTTAFSLYDPHAVLATDIHGTARPSSTGYEAGAFEGC